MHRFFHAVKSEHKRGSRPVSLSLSNSRPTAGSFISPTHCAPIMTPPPELRHIIQRTRDRDRREGAREGRPPFPTRRRLQLRWRRSPPRLLSFLPSFLPPDRMALSASHSIHLSFIHPLSFPLSLSHFSPSSLPWQTYSSRPAHVTGSPRVLNFQWEIAGASAL